ncbi:glycosyltransferase family 2 protein [Mucilaginibacter sp. RT5R15]|nr:glycosyltransferase family 2 protein [Mucilaginibacter flavidus]
MYNASKTIQPCLDSVLKQTYKGRLEIIVVNDGSTDDSLNTLTKYQEDNNIKNLVIIDKENGGVSSARNMGMKASQGDYIALLDADDEWLPTKLERQMEVLLNNNEIDFLGCSRNDEVLRILWKEVKILHKASVRELLIKMFPQTSTAIFKRKLFEQFGGYNESLTHAEDGNLWIRYCANSNFYFLPESLVITGMRKPTFGHSGLSANLREMQIGNEFTFKEAQKEGLISMPFFYFIYSFARIKYLRRIFITKIR